MSLDMRRLAMTQILADLMAKWQALRTNKNATERDFARVCAQIKEAAAELQNYDKGAN